MYLEIDDTLKELVKEGLVVLKITAYGHYVGICDNFHIIIIRVF